MVESKQVHHLCMQQHCIITTEENCTPEKCSAFEVCDPFNMRKKLGAPSPILQDLFNKSGCAKHKPKRKVVEPLTS